MPDYEHHIFISYRRSDDDWVRWTRENFLRALRSLLQPGRGQVDIYIDQSIETGDSWPNTLALNLARSMLLVPVLSRSYFESDWCRLELSLMCHREKLVHYRTRENPRGLIIPVIIDDGERFPEEVQAMQGESLHDYANPFIRMESPRQEELAELLRNGICRKIDLALESVPPFDPAWEEIAHEQFENTFKIIMETQITLPSLELPGMP